MKVRKPAFRRFDPRSARALAVAIAAIAILTVVQSAWLVSNATMVALSYLLVVLVVAAVATRWVAIVTSLLAFLSFNYFFLPPVGTFTISDPDNLAALLTLLAVSIVASHLSSQARQRAREAQERRDELARLFDLTRDILLTTDAPDGISLTARFIAKRFGFEHVAIGLPAGEGLTFRHSSEDVAAVDRARAAGALSTVPLRHGDKPVGMLLLAGGAVAPGTQDAIAGVTAIAIERSQLLEERRDAEVLKRSAELKSAVLASLGHDLRTPMTAVTVAASNLKASWLTDEQKAEQIDLVQTELARLNRLFAHIVDMARIEAHAVAAEPEWVQPSEIVEAAVHYIDHALGAGRLEVELPEAPTLVHVDPALMSAALAHLLENAAQYSPPDSVITVSVSISDGTLLISVRDRGLGIADQDVDRVFERFYRGAGGKQRAFGTGMGLAITRGLVAAHGGRAWAENHPEGGAVFRLSVPTPCRVEEAIEIEH